ncbi:MAG: cytochrome c3 family protein [Elusimicrobia bacterium]|nr:cytochrome c3 family protein [Elusimicrobiota bacterium]
MKNLFLCAVILLTGAGRVRALSVINSKHDLSAASATTGPKAAAETRTCMFCHTVHRPAQRSQLWNRADSAVQFTFYSSNYLNNYLGQATPTMTDLKASKTKLCLSCHDGVTALGSLFNIAPNTLEMTGAIGSASVIGTDLSNDHPVLYDVKPGAGPPTQPGTDAEIQLPPAGDAVKVYGATNRVECTSCHEPHDNTFGKFLVKSNANAALCTSCHQKTGYVSSAHGTSNAAYAAEGAATTVGEYSCRGCHMAHGASSAQAYILRGAEENTCYGCHGAPALPGAKSVKNLFAKASKHPVETVAGAHVNPELDGANLKTGRRHSECWDCHNPHRAKTGTHATPGNAIGGALLGAWGVEPYYTGASWIAATSFTRQVFNDATNYKEYQLCLKCHSYYAYGATPPAGYTDQSAEYNPNNRSAHPVRNSANVQTGAVAPKALAGAQLSPPWNTSSNLGNQTMTCSDCHGSDVASDPAGPHGSASQYMLKGPKRYWPKNAAGALWTLADVKNNANSWSTNLFCANCHPLYANGAWTNNVHEEEDHRKAGVSCVTCHVVVPHGSKRSRLIGYKADPTPYNYGGAGTYDKLVIEGFRKASTRTGYDKDNCSSKTTGCHTGSGTFEP